VKWEEVRLGDILDIKHGYAFKGKYFSSIKTKNILLTPGNFAIGGGYKNTKLKYYNGEIPSDYILKHNDIIVTMTDLSKEADTLGFSAKIPNEPTNVFLHNQRIGLLVFKSDVCNKDYIYWLLRSRNYQKFIAGSASGATVKHTSPSRICAFKWMCPPLKTQKKIAKTLSNYDNLIENNLKQIKLLEEKARLTYEEWFLRFRVDGVELEIDDESGLPFGWESRKFKDILEFRTGKLDSNAVVENGKHDFYTCAKQVFKTDTTCFNGEAVLLGGNNATGNFSLFYANSEFDAYQRTYIITSEILPLSYVYFVIKYYLPFFQTISSGATTKFLTMRILNAMNIIVLPDEVSSKYQKIVNPLFDKVLNLKLQNQNLKEARDILLPRLMMGVIEPW